MLKMLKKILLVTATEAEASALKRIPELITSGDGFLLGDCEISVLITGVGSVATSWGMAKWLSANQKPDLAINIGIAGSYNEEIRTGDVVVPVEDCFADAGIEDGSRFVTLAEAGLSDPDKFPFKKGKIEAANSFVTEAIKKMKPVKAITVNTASGSQQTIDRLIKKYNPDIETMEGATFFYICSGEKILFLALRSISNRVEPRNKDNWNISLALDNLSERLKHLLLSLDRKNETNTGILSMP
jgi:futalosine hydrolase